MNSKPYSHIASRLSVIAGNSPDFDNEKMDEAEKFLTRAIESGEWKNDDFIGTIAGQMANEISLHLVKKPIESLFDQDKIYLLDCALNFEKEYLISLIISFLPVDIRYHANTAYDRACSN